MKHINIPVCLLFFWIPIFSVCSQVQKPIAQSEHLQLVTNGSMFVTGESLLFKANVFSLPSGAPALSSVAYLEIINEAGKSDIQHKIPLIHGQGSGEIELPFHLKTGNYTVVAYTRWMRNFPGSYFYQNEITIVNPLKPSDHTHRIVSKKEPQVLFFPEGGRLIAGNPVTVGYQFATADKKITSGRVINESGESITESIQLTPTSGYFTYTPEYGKRYKLALTFDADSKLYDVPLAQDSGVRLWLEEDDVSFVMRITTSASSDQQNLRYDLLRNGVPIDRRVKPQNITPYETVFAFSKDSLHDAIYTFLVRNSDADIVAYRTFYNKKQLRVKISPGQSVYAPREKVVLRVALPNENIISATLNVRLLDSVEQWKRNTWAAAIGNIDFVEQMIGSPSVRGHSQQLLLMSGVTKDFNQAEQINFLPEIRGQLLTGRITASGKPVASTRVLLTARGRHGSLYSGRTKDDGHFYFNLLTNMHASEVWLTIHPDSARDFTITTVPEFLERTQEFTPDPLGIDLTFEPSLRKRVVYSQIRQAYHHSDNDSKTQASPMKFYGRPDKVYRLDDFTRFPTLEDVFREYVAEVVVKKRGKDYSLVLINPQNGMRYQSSPLMIIDGFPIFDTNHLMDYDPGKVESIEIVNRRYVYSSLEVDGILSLNTYDGNANSLSLQSAQILPYKPFLNKAYEVGPDYSEDGNDLSKIPDYRTQLYWNADITPATEYETHFFTSDVEGTFICELKALTRHGEFIYDSAIITVGKNQARK